MNVLIIDDQVNVVHGMVRGINWQKLHIDRVLTANNADQAKAIITKEKVDIMLCDIEMPGDDGLSLFRWTKSYDSRIECIFLTVHADFEFAKEALRLGSFDYILQPASYEEIEASLKKVMSQIRSKVEIRKYSSYGKSFYESKNIFLEGFLKDWLIGNDMAMESVIKNLEKFHIYITPDTLSAYCIFHIIRWNEYSKKFENSLLKYAFSNILSELFEKYGIKLLLVQLETETYGALFYMDSSERISRGQAKKALERFISVCLEFYGCIIVCYLSDFVKFHCIADQIHIVKSLQKDNVALCEGVFVQRKNLEARPQDLSLKMDEWPRKLGGGETEEVKKAVLEYMDHQQWNFKILKQFYMDFMQTVFKACEQCGISNHQIFEEIGNFDEYLNAYQSVDTMKRLIIQVTDFFHRRHIQSDDNYIEPVIQYIHCNIEKDIQRKELASLVNLNEDYLSRIFKKEKGISLKEYIILEKMRTAQNLLMNTNFSIGMIGAKVGFDNFSYFSQTYKKIMGKTPTEEREQRDTAEGL